MIVRDYFIPDFQLQIPESELEEAIKNKKIPGNELIDMDLIKLNLDPIILACILRLIFFKRKFVIILNYNYLQNHLLNFIKYITQESFKTKLKIISEDDYKNNKEKYNEFIILDGKKKSNDKNNILEAKGLNYEIKINDHFISESKSKLSLALLKNEIKRTFIMARGVSDFIKENDNNQKTSTKGITDYLKEYYAFKIQKDYKKYVNWLIDIAKSYFNSYSL